MRGFGIRRLNFNREHFRIFEEKQKSLKTNVKKCALSVHLQLKKKLKHLIIAKVILPDVYTDCP